MSDNKELAAVLQYILDQVCRQAPRGDRALTDAIVAGRVVVNKLYGHPDSDYGATEYASARAKAGVKP